MKIKENKKKITTFSLFIEQITSSCFAIARLRGFFACAGVYPWTTAKSRSGRIYAVWRVLFRQGNNSRGYYFAKEIVAFNSRDQRPSFDPEYACVDLRSGPLELLPYLALTIAEHQIWMNKSSKSQSLDLFFRSESSIQQGFASKKSNLLKWTKGAYL